MTDFSSFPLLVLGTPYVTRKITSLAASQLSPSLSAFPPSQHCLQLPLSACTCALARRVQARYPASLMAGFPCREKEENVAVLVVIDTSVGFAQYVIAVVSIVVNGLTFLLLPPLLLL